MFDALNAPSQLTRRSSALNRDVRTVAGAALRRHRSQFADQLRQVAPALTIPPLRPAKSIWAIAMVKDEADIIESSVRHLVGQGITNFIVMDNGSSDETPAILARLSAEIPGFHAGMDTEPAHYQGAKMTLVADAARRAGATWVLPFDADEYWYGAHGTVADVLRASSAAIVEARMHNVFPGADGGWRVDNAPQLLEKVVFRPARTATLQEGNHDVARPGRRQGGLRILHVPIRSYEQFIRKIRNGARALALTDLPTSTGDHWRRGGRCTDEELLAQWSRFREGGLPELGLVPNGSLLPMPWPPADDWTHAMPRTSTKVSDQDG